MRVRRGGPYNSASAAADIAAFAGVGRALATDDDHDLGAILDGLEAGHTDLNAAVAAPGRRRLPPAGAAPRRVPRAEPSKLAVASGAVDLVPGDCPELRVSTETGYRLILTTKS